MDTLSKQERSERMALVRAKDTGPEMVVRRLIHAMGFRYRLHVRRLPGAPDLVFPKLAKDGAHVLNHSLGGRSGEPRRERTSHLGARRANMTKKSNKTRNSAVETNQTRRTATEYVASARQRFTTSTNDIEIDDRPRLSYATGGAWVSAWLWVSENGTEL